MQRPLYRGREHRWQRRPATGVRPTELAEDLTLAGDGGIETSREAEEVEHRGGIRADDGRAQRDVGGVDGSAQPGVRLDTGGQACEDLGRVCLGA